jgi:hypothetical protein
VGFVRAGIATLAFAAFFAHAADPPQADPHAGHEGAPLKYTGYGETHAAGVLGVRIGGAEIEGVQVDVYVLQATSPERLAPEGKGPTHLFNVRFVDVAASELIAGVKGSVTFASSGGGEVRRVPFAPFAKHFQSQARLPDPGEYVIGVEYEAGSRTGSVTGLPFVYRRKEAAGADDPHAHHH